MLNNIFNGLRQTNSLKDYNFAASSKKARFIRKAICVRKKEMRLRKSADKKGQHRVD